MRIFLDEAMRKTEFISGVQVQTFDRLVTLSIGTEGIARGNPCQTCGVLL